MQNAQTPKLKAKPIDLYNPESQDQRPKIMFYDHWDYDKELGLREPVLCVLGLTGCGKSTFCNLING